MTDPTGSLSVSGPTAARQAAAALSARLVGDDARRITALAEALAAGPPPTSGHDPAGFDQLVDELLAALDAPRGDLAAAVAGLGRAGSTAEGPAVSFATRVEGGHSRFERLLTRLHEYAEAGRPARPEPVDVVAACAAAVDDLRAADPPDGLVEVTADGPALPADPALLHLLLRHLLTNAARYAGTPGGPVEVRSRTEDGAWLLRVSDHGVGVPTEEWGRVLQPLVRLDRDRAVPGDGMGLAIARRVAQSHAGTIFLERTPGGGATVGVRGLTR